MTGGPSTGNGPRQDGTDPGDLTGATISFGDGPALPTGGVATEVNGVVDLKDYFRTVEAIKKYVLNTVNDTEGCEMRRGGADGPNPYYNQIEGNGAIALKTYHGSPSSLHTPLGTYEISSGSFSSDVGVMTAVMEKLKEELGLVEIVPERRDFTGEDGPVYRITRDLEGKELPKVIYLESGNYIDYNVAKYLWKGAKPDGMRD